MPIIKSAIKRARQSSKRRSHNQVVKNAVKKDLRAALDAIATGDSKAINTALSAASSEMDRAVKKGTLHKNTVARRKSRLAKMASLATETTAKKPAATKKPAAKKTSKK